MESTCDSGVQAQHVIKITVVTSCATSTGYAKNAEQKRTVSEIEIKRQFFPSQDATADVKMFPEAEKSTKKTFGGNKEERFTQYFKKFFGLVNQQPIALVIRSTSEMDVPVEKITELLPPAGEDEGDDEESEEEYDEFEEEIVVMDIRRKSVWRKWLERPPELQSELTAGIPIEDLIEIPSLKAETQESLRDEFFIKEKIECVERPPLNEAEMPDWPSLLENLQIPLN